MTIVCQRCQKNFNLTEEDRRLLRSWTMPEPVFCPSCRLQNRMAYRNENKLYQTRCQLCQQAMISIYDPAKNYVVYCSTCWWSDRWDALRFGRAYNPARSAADQLRDVYRAVPHINLYTANCTNSDYNNFSLNLNSCYLLFGASNDEHCLYGKFVITSKDTVDALSVFSLELCYEAVASERCFNCRFVTSSRDCSDCLMIEECQACTNCIGCFGLHAKEYYVFNEYVGKEEYERIQERYADLTPALIAELRVRFEDLKKKSPHRGSHIYSSEDCSGDFILNSTHCDYGFDLKESEHCRYVSNTPLAKDSMDCIFASPWGLEHCYQTCSSTGTRDCTNCFMVWNSYNVEYSLECHQSHDLFACVGLRQKSFCIFNQQYTEAEYHRLRSRLIADLAQRGEWGIFLPPALSPFGYNETIAQEYFPLTKVAAEAAGFSWHDNESKTAAAATVQIPDRIAEVTDDILKAVLACETCHKNYRIVQAELDFYRRLHVPIPRHCPDCRRAVRLRLRGPYFLYARVCPRCQSQFLTNKSEAIAPIVYCEPCYQKVMY